MIGLRTYEAAFAQLAGHPGGGGDTPFVRLDSGRRRPTGGDGGVRPEMGLHSVFTPVKRDPGCSFGMDLGWDALRDGV